MRELLRRIERNKNTSKGELRAMQSGDLKCAKEKKSLHARDKGCMMKMDELSSTPWHHRAMKPHMFLQRSPRMGKGNNRDKKEVKKPKKKK